ncbi:MAG: hypothetical protein WCA55_21495, partial [Xanthobacteraceae bacterium]
SAPWHLAGMLGGKPTSALIPSGQAKRFPGDETGIQNDEIGSFVGVGAVFRCSRDVRRLFVLSKTLGLRK